MASGPTSSCSIRSAKGAQRQCLGAPHGFIGLLERERIKRRVYLTKDAARADAFDYIEMFYNPKRRHGSNGDLSPVEFERRYARRGT